MNQVSRSVVDKSQSDKPQSGKPKSPPPIREVRTPSFRPPSGSVDCHVHIIGPQAIYPLSPATPVELEDSTLKDFQKVQDALGIPRALIVASGGHAYNYHPTVNILCKEADRYRGVIHMPPDITDRELQFLKEVGVVGVRFYPGVAPPNAATLSRIHELGWSAHFLLLPTVAEAWTPLIEGFAGRFVIEHSGLPNPEEGLQGSAFQRLLRFLDTDRCWVKLSPRFSKLELPPFEDTLPFNRELVRRRPDRLLYGSDYPHPNYWTPMPNEADLLELMLLWAPDEKDRELIMARNPEELFGFRVVR
jgi:2-pyrone-4,6-dicarboxylate lactonase